MIKQNSESFLHENMNSKTMIVFIHGILEGPGQFRELANIAYKKDFSFSSILLPGHGGSGRDFSKSNKYQWLNTTEKEILKFKNDYENIILVGHSMGGLLSVLSYSKHKDKIKGLVLISTPLKVFLKLNIIISSLKIVFGKIRDDDFLTIKAYEAFTIERCSLLTYITWLPRYLDLFYLMICTKKELKNIDIPALLVHTEKDELVSHKSINIFENKLKNNYKILNLNKSGHFYFDNDDFNFLLTEFSLFLDTCQKQ